ASYHLSGSDGRNRWGDYSATSRDPADPGIFWTTQEWAAGATTWSTQLSEVIVPDAGEVRWLSAVSGSFSAGSNWIGGAAPGASSHTIFSRPVNPAGAGYLVTLDAASSVTNDRLSLRQGKVIFDLNGGTYTVTDTNPATPSLTVAEFASSSTLTMRNGTINSVNTEVSAG